MKQGAEAKVEIKEEKIIKRRKTKKYRHPNLDRRIKQDRTEEEVKNIQRAKKHGVNTPETEKESSHTLSQTRINGKLLKNIINQKPGLLEDVGSNIRKLHSCDTIHGDLTTSNIIYNKKIYLIDFGLSYTSDRVEDKAMDIHLLKQVLETSHPESMEKSWKSFLKQYKKQEDSKKVLERLKEVEARGRYK